MKKLILYISIIFLITSTVSVVFAASGADDFTVPVNFVESNADTSIANYNSEGLGYNLHLMIVQHDSLDEAKAGMYNSDNSVNGISAFHDSEYGDEGYEEIIEDNGKYYLISVYSTGGHLESNSDSVVQEALDAIEKFNELNSVTPVSL